MSNHIETRRKLRAICGVQQFNQLLDECILTDDEKEILKLHYLKGKDFRYIGDALGFAENTIKLKHKKILVKLHDFL